MSRPLTAAKVTRRLQVRQRPGMRTRNRSTNSASMAAESPERPVGALWRRDRNSVDPDWRGVDTPLF